MSNGSHASRWSVIALLALTTMVCTDPLGPERDELEEAEDRWALTNAENYVFEFQRFCFCPTDFVRLIRIEVLDGIVSSATYVDTGEPVPPPLTSLPTIDDLLAGLREAIDTAFSVIADYDADLGYPTNVYIDYIENAADDEISYSVTSFQLLDA